MTDRSTPFSLGKGTSIRFDRADIKACENALGVGYSYFSNPGIWASLTACEVFIWRGLRKENEKGELVHVFSLDEEGRDQAGDLVLEAIAGERAVEMNNVIGDAFVISGIFTRKKKGDKKEGDNPENAPKN